MRKAEKLLGHFGNLIEFSEKALMDQKGFVSIHEHLGNLGAGSTIFNFSDLPRRGAIECTTLDDAIIPPNPNGLLWLDVEGSPDLVLGGQENYYQIS